jgi:hypothetical protein
MWGGLYARHALGTVGRALRAVWEIPSPEVRGHPVRTPFKGSPTNPDLKRFNPIIPDRQLLAVTALSRRSPPTLRPRSAPFNLVLLGFAPSGPVSRPPWSEIHQPVDHQAVRKIRDHACVGAIGGREIRFAPSVPFGASSWPNSDYPRPPLTFPARLPWQSAADR